MRSGILKILNYYLLGQQLFTGPVCLSPSHRNTWPVCSQIVCYQWVVIHSTCTSDALDKWTTFTVIKETRTVTEFWFCISCFNILLFTCKTIFSPRWTAKSLDEKKKIMGYFGVSTGYSTMLFQSSTVFLLYDSCVSSAIGPTQILHGWEGWLYLEVLGYIEVASDLAAYNSLSSPAETVCCEDPRFHPAREWTPKVWGKISVCFRQLCCRMDSKSYWMRTSWSTASWTSETGASPAIGSLWQLAARTSGSFSSQKMARRWSKRK